MDTLKRLTAALELAQSGQHELALNEYVWFHEHALEEDPSLRGVRLSFALSYWIELGKAYPPALAKLKEIAEQKQKLLDNGATDWEIFNDVVALNEALEEQGATYKIFVSINNRDPEFAQRCARVATPAIVQEKDFQLARSFLPNPVGTIEYLVDQLNKDASWAATEADPERREKTTEAFLHNYIDDVSMLVHIVANSGDSALSEKMIEMAIDQITEEGLRSAVKECLRNHAPFP